MRRYVGRRLAARDAHGPDVGIEALELAPDGSADESTRADEHDSHHAATVEESGVATGGRSSSLMAPNSWLARS